MIVNFPIYCATTVLYHGLRRTKRKSGFAEILKRLQYRTLCWKTTENIDEILTFRIYRAKAEVDSVRWITNVEWVDVTSRIPSRLNGYYC